eukprot:1349514-Amorphochlora_amoeboformis.AAC.1
MRHEQHEFKDLILSSVEQQQQQRHFRKHGIFSHISSQSPSMTFCYGENTTRKSNISYITGDQMRAMMSTSMPERNITLPASKMPIALGCSVAEMLRRQESFLLSVTHLTVTGSENDCGSVSDVMG